jgi:phosphatidylglycerophosphate synthase
MISELKPKINPLITAIAKPFSKISPNILTLLGIVPPILFLVCMFYQQYILALVTFLGLFLDTIDGAVARMTGKSSAFGAFLDSSLDRVADSIYILGFSAAGIVRWDISATLVVLSLLISYLRSRAELAGKNAFVLNVGIIERPERMIMIFIALAGYLAFPLWQWLGFNFPEITFLLLGLLSLVTVIQRMVRAYQLLK